MDLRMLHGCDLFRFIIPSFFVLGTSISSAEEVEGLTEPFRMVRVASSETGLLETLKCQRDDTVQQDQLLATLDCRSLEVNLRVAEAKAKSGGRLQALAVEKDVRSKRLAGLRELLKKGRASTEEIDRAQADFEIAEANWQTAKEEKYVAELECLQIKEQIERRSIRCPFQGVVTTVECEAGEYLAAHDPAIVTLVQIQPLRIVLHVAPQVAMRAQVGSELPIRFLDSSESATARIDRISPVCDPESGTVRVQLTLDNAEYRWRSGAVCRVDYPDTNSHPATPPQSAAALRITRER